MKRFRDYDPFAWLYTNYWAEEFHQAVQPVLRRALLRQLPKRAKVLDLGCGDGRLVETLTKKGFTVTGLDGSEAMLTYARQRCPKARFLLSDMRSFELPPQFDAAISVFDSLNHVMSTTSLNQVFQRVWRCLRPGGLFVFDLNREEAYVNHWVKPGCIVTDEAVSVARGLYVTEKRLAVCDITLFRLRNDEWTRSDFQLRQRLHRRKTVLAKLKAAGFVASVHDAAELGMKGEIGRARDFFIARKYA